MNVVERQNSKARHVGFFLLVLVLEDEILFVLFLALYLLLRVMGVKLKQSSSS